ncbi:1,6-anhydro-N-acetylmuramyl-L-alanine amidase AmpD [Oceanospirillum beijerinckii]|uniref:1,6-anhydro-N-acetylmuramyl-L-alanine amidase AmpD n=1 Tax=Oceanospirillum beijerinckii TaxID=64976 RepID=UPI00042181E8|nr:1,6-anhydro-N-acetylmuramyl-L-alanine amidase AmpD [Oceanospirillum beijerinckii]
MAQDIWLKQAKRVPSPNYNERPDQVLDLLVIHNISLPPKQFGSPYVEQFFTNCLDHDLHPFFDEIRGVEVSAHLFIRRDGEVIQFVPLNKRAWHAGKSSFQGRENCNDFSIGIEMEGYDDCPYTSEQYARLAEISAEIISYYPSILPEHIVGHSDIAPGRKTDPGPAFDWSVYQALLQASLQT